MDILALLAAVFGMLGSLPGSRITVKERYEMKKRVRELKKREQAHVAKSYR